MAQTNTTGDVVILDDGQFYIALNVNYDRATAPGFLERRCYFGVTMPGGYECVGSFDRTLDGQWSASISASSDVDTDGDARTLGVFGDRLDAISSLWGGRHDAFCRHAE